MENQVIICGLWQKGNPPDCSRHMSDSETAYNSSMKWCFYGLIIYAPMVTNFKTHKVRSESVIWIASQTADCHRLMTNRQLISWLYQLCELNLPQAETTQPDYYHSNGNALAGSRIRQGNTTEWMHGWMDRWVIALYFYTGESLK